MLVVVVSPAEHHQAFGLGVGDVGAVLQQLLGVATDALRDTGGGKAKAPSRLDFFCWVCHKCSGTGPNGM